MPSAPPATASPLLSCRKLLVAFGGVIAVNEVSIDVSEGEVVGLVGPNGSGKSTFLNAVSGLVSANGEVEVSGRPVSLGRPGAIVRHGVYRTYQTPQVDGALSCIENVLVASRDQSFRGPAAAWLRRPAMWKHDRSRWTEASAALERVGLLGRADDSAAGLSYGERRLLEIARALMARPRLLLMDEPAAGLSSAETRRLAELLRSMAAADLTLLVVEHKIGFLEELCDRIVVLELGRTIASGTPQEVWADPAVIAAYLGDAP